MISVDALSSLPLCKGSSREAGEKEMVNPHLPIDVEREEKLVGGQAEMNGS